MAVTGRQAWESSSEMPALVLIVDEYAELADETLGCDERFRFHRAPEPCGRGELDRVDPAADSEGIGTRRVRLPDGRAGLLPCPRVQRRGPGPQTGHARCGMACTYPERCRQVLVSAPEHVTPRCAAASRSSTTTWRARSRNSRNAPQLDDVRRATYPMPYRADR
jgi:hypothetical protein